MAHSEIRLLARGDAADRMGEPEGARRVVVMPATASSGVRPNNVQAMLMASVSDSRGEVPGLQSLATAIGTLCLRSTAIGGFCFSCSA